MRLANLYSSKHGVSECRGAKNTRGNSLRCATDLSFHFVFQKKRVPKTSLCDLTFWFLCSVVFYL
jgi:hypothetical protein